MKLKSMDDYNQYMWFFFHCSKVQERIQDGMYMLLWTSRKGKTRLYFYLSDALYLTKQCWDGTNIIDNNEVKTVS